MTATFRFGDYTLSASTRELRRGDTPIAISPRAFDCLAYLIEHRDRAVGKDELVAAIWERVDVSDTQLGQTVLRARRAVDDDGQTQNVIRTVSRFGYRWVADVTIVDDAAPHHESALATAPPPRETPEPVAALPPKTRMRTIATAVLATAIVLTAAVVLRMRSGEAPPSVATHAPTSAIVLPLRVEADAGEAWLRLGLMDLVAQRLRAGGLAVPPSENTVALLQGAGDDTALALAIRRAAPAALIVDGGVAHAGDRWSIHLRAVAADGTTLSVESAEVEALDAARDAAGRLLGRLGRAEPPALPYGDAVQQRLQRATAAMLGNDLDAARAILVSDPELAHAEPELGYRLAMVDFRAGEYARAEAAYTALLAEPAANDPVFHARLLDGRGAVRIRQDNYAGAEKDYDTAIALLKDLGDAPELGRALTGRGVSRAMRRDFAPALADFGQARVQLAEAGDTLAIARVDTDQGALEMNRDRPQDALGYLESAAAVFERYGAINELMETLESLVSNHLVLLQPADALAASDRSWALAARVTDPNQHLNLVEDRVDAFIVLGRFREAAALLSTLPDEATAGDPFVARRLHALRARLALAGHDDAIAASEAKRALAMPPPSDDLGEGVAEIALTYQRAVLDEHAPMPPGAPSADWIDFSKPPAYPVQALAEAEWAAARDNDAAGSLFQHALDMAESRGEPADVGAVTDSYGPWLLAHGRQHEAGDVIGRVAPWAARDYESALLQVRLFHALGQPGPWAKALAQARELAGERELPADLVQPPRAGAVAISR
ncbi:MAG TPA: winged helix-turn-helix domain-containing protein [Rhodanobacteraceae bacterium]|nr:winged helix-turn-helix domain-containing protein [Rhodanobacteraceae bacterium]